MWENHGSLVVMAARRTSLLLDLQAGGTADAHCTTPISSTIDYLPSSDNLTSRLDLRLGTNAICKRVKQRDGNEGGAREVVTVYGN